MSLRSYLGMLVEAEKQYGDLEALTGRKDNSDVIGMAVELCKMGLRPDDVEHAMRAHYLMKSFEVTADDIHALGYSKWREVDE